MQLERSAYQSGSEPEVLTVRFSDSVTESFASGPMKNPKSAWQMLAKETADRLRIDMHLKELGDGSLAAAFLTAEDCDRLVAGMQPDWQERLIDSLGYSVSLICICVQDREGVDREITALADEYGLEPSVFDDMVEENLRLNARLDLEGSTP